MTYSKKEWFIVISTGLLEIELVYDKRQDTITLDWESY